MARENWRFVFSFFPFKYFILFIWEGVRDRERGERKEGQWKREREGQADSTLSGACLRAWSQVPEIMTWVEINWSLNWLSHAGAPGRDFFLKAHSVRWDWPLASNLSSSCQTIERILNYLWISFISCLGELSITLEPPNCSGLLRSHVFPLLHLPSNTETQLSPGRTWIANHCISILS